MIANRRHVSRERSETDVQKTAFDQILARRRSCALIATITVLSDMSTAPTAGDSTMPREASMPAASGIARILYPDAHQRFSTILR